MQKLIVSRQEIFSAARSHREPWHYFQRTPSDFAAYLLGYIGISPYVTTEQLAPLDSLHNPTTDDVCDALCIAIGAYDSTQLQWGDAGF